MRLSKTTIIVSFWATALSFLVYATSLGEVTFGHVKMSEILLAVFGAGISSLGVGILDYHQQKRELEDKLLKMAEPLISAVGGLRDIDIESIEGTDSPANLLLDYFREQESNAFRKNWAFSFLPVQHDSRNALICAIEQCNESDVESFMQDEGSCSMRYIHRQIDHLNSSIESYRSCDKAIKQHGPLIDDEITHASYLFAWLNKIPLLEKRKDASKTRYLAEFSSTKAAIEKALEPAFQQARLFDCGETCYSEMLACLLDVQKQWLSYAPGQDEAQNSYAANLFEPISQLAKLTKSDLADNYEKLWPTY